MAGAPIACGALGAYDPERVRRIGALIGAQPRPVHEDAGSVLMLDREPVQWHGSRSRGIGWMEGSFWRPGTTAEDWQQAARLGATGLVIDGRQRYLHTAVNGLAPLYWTEEAGATYFASRIDPLVRSSPRPFSIDWDAWAAIIAMRYPLGDRTPFAEVRRLGPFSTLRRRLGRGRAKAATWPWAEIEPGVGMEAAAERLADGVEAVLAPLPGGIVCPLSGGRDSRMLFLSLASSGRVAAAVTVNDDEGDSYEEDLAAPVAAACGVSHERLAGAAGGYAEDWQERARRVEYQFADHAWLVPVARRLEGVAAPVPDGFGIDVFVSLGRHFYTRETLDGNGKAAGRALFDSLRRYGLAQRALTEDFHSPLESRSREQFRAATRQFEGHPSQPMLSAYVTRSLRGVSSYATRLIGERAAVVTPGACDPVVSAALSVRPPEKAEGRLYQAVYELLAPSAAASLPSTAETPRRAPHLARRWRSRNAVEMHRRLLGDGPLAPHLSTELRDWLERAEGVEPSPDLRLGIEAISMLHAWWQRYRDCLRDADPRDLRS